MTGAVEKNSDDTVIAQATYTYDALGNRIGMDENGTQTWTLYDGSDPIMDFNGSGSLEMRYLNGPTGDLVDTVIARESAGGTVAWYLPDRLGTIRDLINNSGSIIDHVDYSAFGTVLDESDPSNGDRMMGFAGMERDTVTGLNLAVYRVQDPGTGRWTSQDPLSFAAGDADLYRYVSNGPTDADDPSGLLPPHTRLPNPKRDPVVPIMPADGTCTTAFFNYLALSWNDPTEFASHWPFAGDEPPPGAIFVNPPTLPPYKLLPPLPGEHLVIPPYSLDDWYTGWTVQPWTLNGRRGTSIAYYCLGIRYQRRLVYNE